MITGNEPAMPQWLDPSVSKPYCELTIRQYFAVMAMQGILANPEFLANHKDIDIHSLSVRNADHLMAELNKDK